MRILRVLAIILLVLLAIAGAAYLNTGRIAVFIVSQANNLDISYSGMTHEGLRSFDFTDLAVTDRGTGAGFVAKRALFEPRWQDLFAGTMTADLAMADVSFTDRNADAAEDVDSIEGLALLPFKGRWQYDTITGRVLTGRGTIGARDLSITGREIKLTVSGELRADATVDAAITIYFADSLLTRIPDDMVRMVLKDEGDGWRSFAVKLHGNYKDPAIEVTGRQFRLKIGVTPS